MYSKKKQPKIMINGWRSNAEVVGELKILEISELDKHGDDFIKAELMDELIRLGMDSYKAGWTQSAEPAQQEQSKLPEPVKPKKAPAKRFEVPSADAVYAYMADKGCSNADKQSQKFVDFYESNGWRVGKNPMKSWEASVRNWMRKNNSSDGRTGPPMQRGSMPDRTAEYEALGLLGNGSGNDIAGELV